MQKHKLWILFTRLPQEIKSELDNCSFYDGVTFGAINILALIGVAISGFAVVAGRPDREDNLRFLKSKGIEPTRLILAPFSCPDNSFFSTAFTSTTGESGLLCGDKPEDLYLIQFKHIRNQSK